jgi:hypothetical protein
VALGSEVKSTSAHAQVIGTKGRKKNGWSLFLCDIEYAVKVDVYWEQMGSDEARDVRNTCNSDRNEGLGGGRTSGCD